MRSLGFTIDIGARMSQRRIPATRSVALKDTFRRLEDHLEDVFANACAAGHREAAADLLALLEKWHARRAIGTKRERRAKDKSLQRARRGLKALNGSSDDRAARSYADQAE